jgi:hypothetical protein
MGRGLLFIVLMNVAGCAACDGDVLVEVDGDVDAGFEDAGFEDAGFEDAGFHDAGFADAGFADAGFADAGFADAGFADAGLADAGFDCVFEDLPSDVPFVCEGDEDACDDVGEQDIPDLDMVATWSRVEGDEFIIDVRFAAFPFRRMAQLMGVLLDEAVIGGPSELNAVPPSPAAGETLIGQLRLDLTNGVSGGRFAFPPQRALLFPQSARQHLAACAPVSIGRNTPVLRYRWSLAQVGSQGQVGYWLSSFRGSPAPIGDNVSDVSPIDFVVSRGGAPDDDDNFLELCDLTCESAGGTLQPRED